MRLCDEYCQRMGLAPLVLRHSSKFFVFFNDGAKLFSCRWINSSSSLGYYEACECRLTSVVAVDSREKVEWDHFEKFMDGWLRNHSGLVFDRARIFDLVWDFFVRRNDRFLSANYDPLLIYSTLDASNPGRSSLAMDVVQEILSMDCDAGRFWESKAQEILSRYAHWLSARD